MSLFMNLRQKLTVVTIKMQSFIVKRWSLFILSQTPKCNWFCVILVNRVLDAILKINFVLYKLLFTYVIPLFTYVILLSAGPSRSQSTLGRVTLDQRVPYPTLSAKSRIQYPTEAVFALSYEPVCFSISSSVGSKICTPSSLNTLFLSSTGVKKCLEGSKNY